MFLSFHVDFFLNVDNKQAIESFIWLIGIQLLNTHSHNKTLAPQNIKVDYSRILKWHWNDTVKGKVTLQNKHLQTLIRSTFKASLFIKVTENKIQN